MSYAIQLPDSDCISRRELAKCKDQLLLDIRVIELFFKVEVLFEYSLDDFFNDEVHKGPNCLVDLVSEFYGN